MVIVGSTSPGVFKSKLDWIPLQDQKDGLDEPAKSFSALLLCYTQLCFADDSGWSSDLPETTVVWYS